MRKGALSQDQTQPKIFKNNEEYIKDLEMMRRTIYRDSNGKLDLDKFKLAY